MLYLFAMEQQYNKDESSAFVCGYNEARNKLMSLGFSKGYAHRAISVYQNNYGIKYDLNIIKEIIYRLLIKDKLKQYKKLKSIHQTRNEIQQTLYSMNFDSYHICSSLTMYEIMNEMVDDDGNIKNENKNEKRYNLQHIIEMIMKLRANNNRLNIGKNNWSNGNTENDDQTESNINYKNSDNLFVKGIHKNGYLSISPSQSFTPDTYSNTHAIIQTNIAYQISDYSDKTDNGWNDDQDLFPKVTRFENHDHNKCTINDILKCPSFKRVDYLLYKYKKWIKHEINNNDNNYMNKISFIETMKDLNCYKNSELLDDYHHLIYCHCFHDIYKNLTIRCKFCDKSKNICLCLRRNHRFKIHKNKSMLSLYFGEKIEEINLEQIMDAIHSHFLHDIHLGLSFTQNEMELIGNIQNSNHNNDNDEKECNQNCWFDDNKKIKSIQQILAKKRKWRYHLTNDFNGNNNKFMTEMKSYNINEIYSRVKSNGNKQNEQQQFDTKHVNQVNNMLIHDFGIKYNYHNKSDKFYVKKRYKSLKQELLAIITKSQFDILLIRSNNIKDKKYSNLLTAEYNDYDIEYLSLITINHILSMLIYSNFVNQRRLFQNTFFKSTKGQSDKDMIKLHCKMANLGQYLFEIVQVFGTKTTNNDTFYHIIYNCCSSSQCFTANKICISSSLSTTNKLQVALNCNDKSGIILKLKDDNPYFEMKYFDTKYLATDFVGESELFFLGNTYSIHKFKVNGIIQNIGGDSVADYSKYIHCLSIINDIICGNKFDKSYHCKLNHVISSTITSMLSLGLIQKKAMKNNNNNNVRIPQYIKKLMHLYYFDINEIKINWSTLSNFDGVIQKLLCFQEFINLDILKIFKNASKLVINGETKLLLNEVIIEYIFMYLNIQNRHIFKLKSLSICNVHKSSLSFCSIINSFKEKFERIRISICIENKGKMNECLIFQVNEPIF